MLLHVVSMDMSWLNMWTVIIALFLLLTACWFWSTLHSLKLLHIPAPWGIPLLGNAHRLFSEKSLHMSLVKMKANLEYKDIVRMDILGVSAVFLNSLEAIQSAFVQNGVHFLSRPPSFRAKMYSGGDRNITFQPNVPVAKELRKLLHQSIKGYGVGLQRLENVVQVAVDDLVSSFKDTSHNSFDPQQDLYAMFAQVVSILTIGVQIARDDPLVGELEQLDKVFIKALQGGFAHLLLDTLPLLRFLPGYPPWRQVQQMDQQCQVVIEKLKICMKSVEREVDWEGEFRSAYSYFSSREGQEINGFTIDSETTWRCVLDLFIGGTLTTSANMYCLLNVLVHHPEIQEKAAREIEEQLGNRAVKVADRARLPYTQALVLETLRHSSVLPLSFAHLSTADTQILNYNIPKDTAVVANLFGVLHDETFWGDPWTFRPERFLDDQGEVVSSDDILMKWFLPFGAGPRSCPGETLARSRLFLVIVSLVRNFQFLPPDDPRMMSSCDPRDYIICGTVQCAPYKMRTLLREKV